MWPGAAAAWTVSDDGVISERDPSPSSDVGTAVALEDIISDVLGRCAACTHHVTASDARDLVADGTERSLAPVVLLGTGTTALHAR